ncbi:MAG: nucleoside deaminase [Actinobacteria bacterium]|nr:nucleoside deaminase [Actinomycetota bacterium]
MNYQSLMDQAIELAKSAAIENEVPVGSIIVDEDEKILGQGFNKRESSNNPISHAEINAINDAVKNLKNWRAEDLTIFVTLEPCVLCAGAILQARFKRLVFGAWDEKAGAVGSVWDLIRDPRSLHQVEVVAGIKESECSELLQDFFKQFRD